MVRLVVLPLDACHWNQSSARVQLCRSFLYGRNCNCGKSWASSWPLGCKHNTGLTTDALTSVGHSVSNGFASSTSKCPKPPLFNELLLRLAPSYDHDNS